MQGLGTSGDRLADGRKRGTWGKLIGSGKQAGVLDFGLLGVLGDFAKSFEYSAIPSETDLETLAWTVLQQGTAVAQKKHEEQPRVKKLKTEPRENGQGGAAGGGEEGGAGGVGMTLSKGGPPGQREFLGRASKALGRKGQFPSSMMPQGQGLALSRIQHKVGGRDSPLPKLNEDRAAHFFMSLEGYIPHSDLNMTLRILRRALDLYKQRNIDHVALAGIVNTLFKDYTSLIESFFSLTCPDSKLPTFPNKGASAATAVPTRPRELLLTTWLLPKDDYRRPPLSKKAPVFPVGKHYTKAQMKEKEEKARQEQAFVVATPEDDARAFLSRARAELINDFYQLMLDELVAMRLSFRSGNFADVQQVHRHLSPPRAGSVPLSHTPLFSFPNSRPPPENRELPSCSRNCLSPYAPNSSSSSPTCDFSTTSRIDLLFSLFVK